MIAKKIKLSNKDNFLKVKKRVIIYSVILIIFVLVGVGIFIPTKNLYAVDYEGADEAFEKSGTIPTGPSDYDSAAEASDYTAISSSDNTRWETSQAAAGDWDSQIYTFIINENVDDITNLILEWEGYGDTDSSFLTYFYIWNNNSSSWEELDSADFTSETDITLTGNIVSNISNYIDSVSKELTIMTTSQKSGVSTGQPCGAPEECLSGFCVDGYCCNNACTGDCEACNLSGTEGTCTLRPANDNVEVTTVCYYCDGFSDNSVEYSGDEGVGCSGGCSYCSSGSCTIRVADDNIECGTCERCDSISTDCQYVDIDEEGKDCTTVCYGCDGSGSCVPIADYQADEKGSNQCDADAPHCVSDTFYGGYTCVSGACTNNNDIGCCQGSYCAANQYCSLAHACALTPLCQTKIGGGFGTAWAPVGSQPSGCDATCRACAGGACDNALKNTDPGFDCGTASCGTGNCNGVGGCLGYDTGDRNCPACLTCADFDIHCEVYPNYTQDTTGPNVCNSTCSACKSGSCTSGGSDLTTAWGSGLYGCTGSNQRCFGAICRTCTFGYGATFNSAGGYLYNDGCSGCAAQGGKVCWYMGFYETFNQTTCNHICQDHGAQCVVANWNDPGCNVGKHLVPLIFTWNAPLNTPEYYYRCVDGYPYDSPYVSWSCINNDGVYCKGWAYNSPGAPLYFDKTDCWVANQCACSERDPTVPQDCSTQSYWNWPSDTLRKRICACTF